ncbi:hypothetical protein QC761_0080470 [Podospora bellae-mahoneyi]|uniref:Uncharacterized protein n=1 Tax=Podospora bellae-mahoneyi TaxID=2093777 RepID=A0ABR0FDK2_9PEZI|nr:hypothetical protein QC761_0080470 [Podospora bellae-mahoneyi]
MVTGIMLVLSGNPGAQILSFEDKTHHEVVSGFSKVSATAGFLPVHHFGRRKKRRMRCIIKQSNMLL